MKKLLAFLALGLILQSCSVLSGLKSFSKCEFRYHSTTDLVLCGVNLEGKSSMSEFSFSETNLFLASVLRKKIPLGVNIQVEVRNPGPNAAAVSRVEWIALLDDLELTRGVVENEVHVSPNGGISLIPVPVNVDLMDYLEGEKPAAIANFVMNLMDAGSQSSELQLKIKPSVKVGSVQMNYPGYFVIKEAFSSGSESPGGS